MILHHLRAGCLATLISALAVPAQDDAALSLVESLPIETSLDSADIPDTHAVWIRMIDGARSRIDFAHFYASNQIGSRLEAVIQAIESAALRGVAIRFLADEKFYGTYPETLDRLAAMDGVSVRRIDLSGSTGGVLHAKYMLVDGQDGYVGSANFDWRALEHIQELGVRIRSREAVAPFQTVFESDWRFAGGEAPTGPSDRSAPSVALQFRGETVTVTPVFSPRGMLPNDTWFDLPRIVAAIDGAEQRVLVQLLNYKAAHRDRSYFAPLETALRSAAARGVQVRLMCANWSQRRGTIEGLKSLQVLPNIDIKLVTIPVASTGFVPFGRVSHSKYMVVDGRTAWVGTSNWSGDYFEASRNAGVMVEGEAFGARLQRYFLDTWSSPYAALVDPGRTYTAPAVAEPPAQVPGTQDPGTQAPGTQDGTAKDQLADGKWPVPTELFDVVRVVDGDTIHIQRHGNLEKLRLLSVDTEEKISGRPGRDTGTKPETAYGQECAEWAREFFDGLADEGAPTRVGLQFPGGVEERDIYGRLLCHVVLPDGTDFNVLLVETGRSPYFPKYGYSRLCHGAFLAAEAAARRQQLGIWDPGVNADGPRRSYDRLVPWWHARAAALEDFRQQASTNPGVVSAEDPDALQQALESDRPVSVFGQIERFFDESDGSRTALFRTPNRDRALRVTIPAALLDAADRLGVTDSVQEFRQNYLWVDGKVTRGPRGFRIVTASIDQWRIAEPPVRDR